VRAHGRLESKAEAGPSHEALQCWLGDVGFIGSVKSVSEIRELQV